MDLPEVEKLLPKSMSIVQAVTAVAVGRPRMGQHPDHAVGDGLHQGCIDVDIGVRRILRSAAHHIQKLPTAQQKLPHWQAVVDELIMAAEGRGPLLHARVGMLRAMNHGRERVFRSDRKETH
jgi:hypothetical protein